MSRRIAFDISDGSGVAAMAWVLTDAGMGEAVYPEYEGRPAVYCRGDGSIHTGIDGGRSTTYAEMLGELERRRKLLR